MTVTVMNMKDFGSDQQKSKNSNIILETGIDPDCVDCGVSV